MPLSFHKIIEMQVNHGVSGWNWQMRLKSPFCGSEGPCVSGIYTLVKSHCTFLGKGMTQSNLHFRKLTLVVVWRTDWGGGLQTRKELGSSVTFLDGERWEGLGRTGAFGNSERYSSKGIQEVATVGLYNWVIHRYMKQGFKLEKLGREYVTESGSINRLSITTVTLFLNCRRLWNSWCTMLVIWPMFSLSSLWEQVFIGLFSSK